MKGATMLATLQRLGVRPSFSRPGEDQALLRQFYPAGRARHPESWFGPTRQWEPVSAVCLNPGPPKQEANNTPNAI